MSLRSFVASSSGVLASLALIFGVTMPVNAAATSTNAGVGNGLKVSPVTTNITVNPGQTQTVQVYVQNVTKGTVELQALVNDFTATTNETGIPALLLNPDQYAPTHSLKRFVAPIGNFSLKAGEQKVVNVLITIPKTASAGGYYGAVRFAPASSSSTSNVTLSASVGSLILVRVPGDIKEQVRLDSFDVRAGENDSPRVVFTSGKGLVVAARFENLGDIQEQPFGKVILKQGNTTLASYEINDTTPRGNVLPNSIRKFTVTLDKVGAFGRYTLSGNFGYGSSGQLLSAQTTFYVIPVGIIATAVIVVLAILFAVFVLPRLVREYNRRVVERATRRK